jgi:hypothetical protein
MGKVLKKKKCTHSKILDENEEHQRLLRDKSTTSMRCCGYVAVIILSTTILVGTQIDLES